MVSLSLCHMRPSALGSWLSYWGFVTGHPHCRVYVYQSWCFQQNENFGSQIVYCLRWSPANFFSLGNSRDRFVCHKKQCQAQELLLQSREWPLIKRGCIPDKVADVLFYAFLILLILRVIAMILANMLYINSSVRQALFQTLRSAS